MRAAAPRKRKFGLREQDVMYKYLKRKDIASDVVVNLSKKGILMRVYNRLSNVYSINNKIMSNSPTWNIP